MRALEAEAPSPPPLLDGTPWPLLGGLGAAYLASAALVIAGGLPAAAARVVGVAAFHGGLLATALVWAAAAAGVPRQGRRAALVCVTVVAAAHAAAVVEPRVALPAAAAVPIVLAALGRQPWAAALGLRRARAGAVVAGLAVGVFLGGHLVAAAGATLGYRPRPEGLPLAAVAYDLGANVPSAEVFFRGALLDRLHRRASFAAAAALSTAAALVRYLLDPLLPRAVEVMAGALFYLAVLGAAAAWLRWWSGSVLPGALAGLAFFCAYRLLAVP